MWLCIKQLWTAYRQTSCTSLASMPLIHHESCLQLVDTPSMPAGCGRGALHKHTYTFTHQCNSRLILKVPTLIKCGMPPLLTAKYLFSTGCIPWNTKKHVITFCLHPNINCGRYAEWRRSRAKARKMNVKADEILLTWPREFQICVENGSL